MFDSSRPLLVSGLVPLLALACLAVGGSVSRYLEPAELAAHAGDAAVALMPLIALLAVSSRRIAPVRSFLVVLVVAATAIGTLSALASMLESNSGFWWLCLQVSSSTFAVAGIAVGLHSARPQSGFAPAGAMALIPGVLLPTLYWMAVEIAATPPASWLVALSPSLARSVSGGLPWMLLVLGGMGWGLALWLRRPSSNLKVARTTTAAVLALAVGGLMGGSLSSILAQEGGSALKIEAELLSAGAWRPGETHPLLIRLSGPTPGTLEVSVAGNAGQVWTCRVERPEPVFLMPVFLPEGAVRVEVSAAGNSAQTELPSRVLPRRANARLVAIVSGVEGGGDVRKVVAPPSDGLALAEIPAQLIQAATGPSWAALACFDALVVRDLGDTAELPEWLAGWLTTGGVALTAMQAHQKGEHRVILVDSGYGPLRVNVEVAPDTGAGVLVQVAGLVMNDASQSGPQEALEILQSEPLALASLLSQLSWRGTIHEPAGPGLGVTSNGPLLVRSGQPNFPALAAARGFGHSIGLLLGCAALLGVAWLVLPFVKVVYASGSIQAAPGIVTLLAAVILLPSGEPLVAVHQSLLTSGPTGSHGLATTHVAVSPNGELHTIRLSGDTWATPWGGSSLELVRDRAGIWTVNLPPGGMARIDRPIAVISPAVDQAALIGELAGSRAWLYADAKKLGQQSRGSNRQVSSGALAGEATKVADPAAAGLLHAWQLDNGYARREYGFALVPAESMQQPTGGSGELGVGLVWWPLSVKDWSAHD